MALFLVVVGARLWLVGAFGNPLPYWDQWDGEAGETLKPWLDGNLHFADLFQPHAEHRIFWTRATALGLLALNGQWDARLEMVMDAVLCGVIALGLAAALRRALAPRFGTLVGLSVAALFALPFAWENTLAGFQSQFYFLFGWSLLGVWGLGTQPAGSRGWFLGGFGALAACFAMGAGLLAAAAVLGWRFVEALRARRWPAGGEMVTWLACVAVLAVGWQSRVAVPQHAGLRVESFGAWLAALGRCLAWPRVLSPTWAPVMVAPLLLLAWTHFRRRPAAGDETENPAPRAPAFLLLLASWVFLQAAAMAFARGANAFPPQSRYMDVLALGAVLNVLAAAWLVSRQPANTWRQQIALAAATAWAFLLLSGVGELSAQNLATDLPTRAARQAAGAATTRAYLASHGDRRILSDGPLTDDRVPYPNPTYLADLLDDSRLRAALPAEFSARPPGALSRLATAAARAGGWIGALGVLLGLGAFIYRAAAVPDPGVGGSSKV